VSPGTVTLPCAAVLFDADGTLIDSTALIERAARAWAPAYGIDPDEYLAGAHGRRTADRVADFLPAEQVHVAAERLDALEDELQADGGVIALPGVLELLSRLGDLPWAVVTSMDTAQLTSRAQAAGVPLPEVLVTAEDVTQGKPDPSGYLLAARRLNVEARGCVVVEDSPAGVSAGRAAGATVLAVTTTHPVGLLTEADLIVGDLTRVRAYPGALRVIR
jgi:sugar-phosphatase